MQRLPIDHWKVFSPPRLSRWLHLTLAASAALALVLGLARQWSATAAVPSIVPSALGDTLVPTAYLYRLDPASGNFFTITLPEGGQPADVHAVAEGARQHIWFSEPGLGRIGHIVFTSSIDYAQTEEFNVGSSPVSLAASNTDVWFTLPAQNQVGHLDLHSSTVTRYDLPSMQADLADIQFDSSGHIWVTARMADRLAMVTTGPTVSITEYALPAPGQRPEGLSPSADGSVWFATGATGYLWQLRPETGQYPIVLWLGSESSPYHLAQDHSNHIWVTLKNSNQLAQVTVGTWPTVAFYAIPTPDSHPTAIGVDSLDRVYFAEQSATKIGQLVTASPTTFNEYPLPQPRLKLGGLAVASDDAVWAVAYFDVHQVYLPVVMRNYDSTPPPFGAQTYGEISASTGLTQWVEAGGRWLRFPVFWSDIEPTNTIPAAYNWANLDASVQAATSANVHLILFLEGNPSWAAARPRGPIYNLADFQEFVGAIVARYPQVEKWEFYNEPDDRKAWGLDGAGYAAMLQAIYPGVKAANPNAQVVMGGLALDWFTEDGGPFVKRFLNDVVANCAGPCFDIANFHYYPLFRPTWEPYGRDIIGKANYVRQVLAAYGYNRPVINTEMGWPSGSEWGSPELQARYVVKGNSRALAAGLGLTVWYSLCDADISDPGLLDSSGLAPRPAYYAYATIISLMTHARYVRTIPSSETGSAYLEGYQFSVPAAVGLKRLDVYWYDCPSMYSNYVNGLPTDCSNTAPLKINAAQIAVIDKVGSSRILDDVDDGITDGKVSIPGGVGSNPIYVDYAP